MGKAILWPMFWLLITVASIWAGKEAIAEVFFIPSRRVDLVVNLLASALFLPIIFVLLKPKILISPYIMENSNDSRFPGQTVYQFKIINSSIFFKAFDVSLSVWAVTEQVRHGSNDIVIEDVPLVRNSLFYIESVLKGCTIVDKNCPCACTFTSTKDIRSMMVRRDQYIQLQVIVRHGLSGLSGVFTKKYYDAAKTIETGEFEHGLALGKD